MTGFAIASVAAMLGWSLLASMIPLLPSRYRFSAFWAMIALGVPVLGWLTLHWGPGAGVAAFAFGLWLVLRQPMRDCSDGRHRHPQEHQPRP